VQETTIITYAIFSLQKGMYAGTVIGTVKACNHKGGLKGHCKDWSEAGKYGMSGDGVMG
jgi:hypothetical protein